MYYSLIAKTLENKVSLTLNNLSNVSAEGETKEQALEALKRALHAEYHKTKASRNKLFPLPDSPSGGLKVGIDFTMKVMLLNAMRMSGDSSETLSIKLKVSYRRTAGLLDLATRSSMDLMEQALAIYGVEMHLFIAKKGVYACYDVEKIKR